MSSMDTVEDALKGAVKRARGKGISLISGDWGVVWDDKSQKFIYSPTYGGDCGCLMGCFLVETQPTPRFSLAGKVYLTGSAADGLGVDESVISAIIIGFDDDKEPKLGSSVYHKFGGRLSGELKPVCITRDT
jgi:hypothetical protein